MAKLSPELRYMIWRAALPPPRQISIGGWRDASTTDVSFTITANAQLPLCTQIACRESRLVFLQRYTMVPRSLLSMPEHQLPPERRFRPLYIDFERDTITVTCFAHSASFARILSCLNPSSAIENPLSITDRIQKLAVDETYFKGWRRQETLTTIHQMSDLKQLTILVPDDRFGAPATLIQRPAEEEPADPSPASDLISMAWLRKSIARDLARTPAEASAIAQQNWVDAAEKRVSDMFAVWWLEPLYTLGASLADLAREKERVNNGVLVFPSTGRFGIDLGWVSEGGNEMYRWHEPETRPMNKYGHPVRYARHRIRWYCRPVGGHRTAAARLSREHRRYHFVEHQAKDEEA
jgi:hypothetical protein